MKLMDVLNPTWDMCREQLRPGFKTPMQYGSVKRLVVWDCEGDITVFIWMLDIVVFVNELEMGKFKPVVCPTCGDCDQFCECKVVQKCWMCDGNIITCNCNSTLQEPCWVCGGKGFDNLEVQCPYCN